MKIEEIKISDIKPYEKNAKQHPSKQIELLKKNIEKFGFTTPCLIDENNNLIAGHGRLEAIKQLNWETVPCVRMEGLTEQEVKALRLADNKIAEMGDWDMKLAIAELKELDKETAELTGFDLDLLIEPDEKDDVIPEDAPPVAKLGDLWALGRHRLLCGDATKIEDVERLMDGKKADMVFTDPPYGVSYVQEKYTGLAPNNKFNSIKNDELRGDDLYNFLSDVWKNLKEHTKSGASFYVWSPALKESFAIFNSLVNSGIKIQAQIIWNKASLVLSRSDYHWKHENCWYGFWENGKHQFYGDRTFTTVWKKEPEEKELLKWVKSRVKEDFNGKSTVWNIRKDSDYKHPTQKPVFLGLRGITNSSKSEDIILDLFGGSGSTLIACEKTNRICYMSELDPKYCDVIIKRYEDFSGNKAEKL